MIKLEWIISTKKKKNQKEKNLHTRHSHQLLSRAAVNGSAGGLLQGLREGPHDGEQQPVQPPVSRQLRRHHVTGVQAEHGYTRSLEVLRQLPGEQHVAQLGVVVGHHVPVLACRVRRQGQGREVLQRQIREPARSEMKFRYYSEHQLSIETANKNVELKTTLNNKLSYLCDSDDTTTTLEPLINRGRSRMVR